MSRLVHEADWKVGERRRGVFDGGLLRTFTTVRYSDGWDGPQGWHVKVEGQESLAWIGGGVPDVFELLEADAGKAKDD